MTTPDLAAVRLAHLTRVREARAEQISADRRMERVRRSARLAGCTPAEIAATIAIIERADRRDG